MRRNLHGPEGDASGPSTNGQPTRVQTATVIHVRCNAFEAEEKARAAETARSIDGGRPLSNVGRRTHNPSVAGSSPARPTRETAGQRPVLRPRVRTRTTCVPRWSRIGRAAVQRLRRRRPWADFLSDISVSNLGRYAGLSRHDVGEGGPLPRRKSICVSTLRVFSGTISLPATIPESGS